MSKGPGGYAVMNAVTELSSVREQLIAICPEIESDDQLFLDMLESEAGDSLAVIEKLIEASLEADALADSAKTRKADMAERQARFERRCAAFRTVALQAMETINLRKIERGHFSASIANRPARVVITDEAALPPSFTRVKVEPDKAAIAAALKAGDIVAGASLSNGGTGLTVRTK